MLHRNVKQELTVFQVQTLKGQSSSWSPTQTVTLTENLPTRPQQTIPEYPTWTILPIFIITTATGIITKKRLKSNSKAV